MKVQPYLYFDGRCEEALEFYKQAVGAEVIRLMRFKENPEPQYNPPNSGDKVMHASFRIGETELMASDGDCGGQTKFQGISLTLSASDVAHAERLFAALGAGGQVQMPMNKTFFAERFGMVADKFGVSWMVIAEK
jgi:PhnB protein